LQLFRKDTVEGQHFLVVDVVLLTRHIADQVGEELEEGALVGELGGTVLQLVEHIEDGLDGVLKVEAAIVRCDGLVGDDDQFGVVLNVIGVVAIVYL
jgi:hypothetical protein